MTAPLASMTGFARTDGSVEGVAWVWELRSVNGRGLELRFRLPPGLDRLEPQLRDAAQKRLRRGNVNASLTVRRDEAVRVAVDPVALDQALSLALALQARIPGAPPLRAEALLALPGVMRPEAAGSEAEAGRAEAESVGLVAGFAAALDQLVAARRSEGARLAAVLTGKLDEIVALHAAAAGAAADQPAMQRARLMENLQALLREATSLPEERIAQEVALLAARSDTREELDRLASHIAAARALLAEGVNIGRRLDFLVQEFNREANTLCSKSASGPLTAIGLELKAAIEQLREQAANIE
jgi:uncharacterized protein (TIGR00255 family)